MKKKLQNNSILKLLNILLKSINSTFIVLILLIGMQATAQTFPVQVIPQVTTPPPVYLTDYANTNNTIDRIRASVLLTDLTVMSRQVRLKLYIEGNGINAQSRDFVIGSQPIFLDGGIPVQLGSIDLAPYFELQNLQGISAGAYANTLPEGLYQFCFEVYDVISGNRISSKSCANVLIFLNEPPFLNLPQNNINLEAMNPQNLLFQWTPRHINVSNVEYEFSLVEIWDYNMDPQAVFLASPPFYQITTRATSLLYGVAEPQLLEGKRYAWRVRAKAINGIDEIGLFSNNGYSEIFAFTYQGECAEPTYLSVEEVSTKTATFRWQGDIDNLNYRISYRKAIDDDGNTGNANTFEWFENDTTREEFVVIDLEPNTMYEWRVGGYCADGTLTFTESTTFTTMAEEAEAYYNCGIEPSIDIANQVLLETLQIGDVIKAGDFNVKIQEVDGTNSFTGKGYTTVGFLKNIKIALVFTNIQVNTDYQFVSGEIKTIYDPTWSNILDIDEVIDEFEDLVDVFTGDDIVIIELDFDISENDINVDTDNGQIIITDPATGETSTHNYDSGDTYTITDQSGDRFEIDKEGNVTQTGEGAEGGPATAANTIGITDGHASSAGDPSVLNIEKHPIAFTYRKGADTKYELDVANNDYENAKYHKVTIDGTDNFYYPIHKAVVEGGETDHFYVDVNNVSTYIKTDELIFKTVSGTKVDAVKEGDASYKISVKGRTSYVNEEAIITFKDSVGKQHVLSSFFIHHIKKFPPIDVKVVLVNGANAIEGLQAKLDAIYKPTGVSFTVNTAVDEITIPESEWDVDVDNGQIDYNGSDLASDHPKELRAIKDYYKKERPGFDSKAYHLFIIDDSMPITKALAGFMPKKNQWGFLFESQDNNTNIQKKEDLSTIAAHELGHGVFALGHPFGEDETKHGNADTWLMDYSNGTELAYPNWAKMSSDKLELYLFQDTQDGEFGTEQYLIGYNVLPGNFSKHVNANSYSFVSPVNKIFSIPKEAFDVTFGAKGELFAFSLPENGKNERYVATVKGDKYVGYTKSFNKDIDWKQRVYQDKISISSSGAKVTVYTGKLNKTNSEDCGIDLYKGQFTNTSSGTWNSGGNGETINKTFSAFNAIGDRSILVEKIQSPGVCIPAGPGKDFYDYIISNNQLTEEKKAEINQIALLYNQIGEKLIGDYNAQTKDKFNRLSFTQRILYEISVEQNGYDFELYKNKLEDYIDEFEINKQLLSGIDEQDRAITLLNKLSKTQIEDLDMGLRLQALKALTSERMRGKFYTLWGLTNDSNAEDEALRLLRYTPESQNQELIDSLITNKDLLVKLEKGFNDIGWIYDDGNFKVFSSDILSSKFLLLNKGDLEDKLTLYEEVHEANNVFKWTSSNFLAVQDGELEYGSELNADGNIDFSIKQIVGYQTVWTGNSAHESPIYETITYDAVKPFEWIALYTEKAIPALEFDANSMHFVPAILFHYVIQDKINENTQKSLNIAVDVASLAIGIGEIKAGVKGARLIFATVDVIISASDIVIISFEDQIINNFGEEGKQFVERFNTIAAIVGITNIGYEGVVKVQKIFDEDLVKAVEFWSKNQTRIKELLSETQFKGYDDYVNDLKSISTVVDAASDIVRGVTKEKFLNSVDDFIQNPQLGEEAWLLFKDEKWSDLENLINSNNLNGSWPPNFGFRSIVKIEKGKDLSGKIFDRFQGPGDISGRYASPVYQGENLSDLYFTYDSRALSTNIKEGTNYVKFKFNDNIPDDLTFEYGGIVPWFGSTGLGDQIQSSKTLKDLYDNGIIEIVEQLEFKSGKWEKIK